MKIIKITNLTNSIESAKSLSELAQILRSARENNTDNFCEDIEGTDYIAELPVFGNNEPENTIGIFSWDDNYYMDGDYNLYERDDK
jgi:hypothetical protein